VPGTKAFLLTGFLLLRLPSETQALAKYPLPGDYRADRENACCHRNENDLARQQAERKFGGQEGETPTLARRAQCRKSIILITAIDMNNVEHMAFRRLDLNLLVAFDALVTEKNVTRAAARLCIGQPAMSHALSRLRELFADEILFREGASHGVDPTRQHACSAHLYSGLLLCVGGRQPHRKASRMDL
jgi:hypothetical protein